MKQISILLCSVVLCLQCLAQADSSIVSNKQLKKGFYKNYQEYLDNNPSITADFTTKLYTATKKDPTIIAGSYQLTNSDVKVKKIWGFCDGENVFVKVGGLVLKDYWKLQVLGPHPYILYKEKMIMAVGPPLMALGTLAATAALPPGFNVMGVTKSGKVKYLWQGTMKKILASQPELLAAFKKEARVLSNAHRIKYLTLFSEAVTAN